MSDPILDIRKFVLGLRNHYMITNERTKCKNLLNHRTEEEKQIIQDCRSKMHALTDVLKYIDQDVIGGM
jgi:hypothetical protein